MPTHFDKFVDGQVLGVADGAPVRAADPLDDALPTKVVGAGRDVRVGDGFAANGANKFVQQAGDAEKGETMRGRRIERMTEKESENDRE